MNYSHNKRFRNTEKFKQTNTAPHRYVTLEGDDQLRVVGHPGRRQVVLVHRRYRENNRPDEAVPDGIAASSLAESEHHPAARWTGRIRTDRVQSRFVQHYTHFVYLHGKNCTITQLKLVAQRIHISTKSKIYCKMRSRHYLSNISLAKYFPTWAQRYFNLQVIKNEINFNRTLLSWTHFKLCYNCFQLENVTSSEFVDRRQICKQLLLNPHKKTMM